MTAVPPEAVTAAAFTAYWDSLGETYCGSSDGEGRAFAAGWAAAAPHIRAAERAGSRRDQLAKAEQVVRHEFARLTTQLELALHQRDQLLAAMDVLNAEIRHATGRTGGDQ